MFRFIDAKIELLPALESGAGSDDNTGRECHEDVGRQLCTRAGYVPGLAWHTSGEQAMRRLWCKIALAVLLGPWSAQAASSQAKQGAAACIPGELRSYATIHSIGIEWDVSGDANHNAKCLVWYRPKDTGVWKSALPLLRVDFFGWYAETKADRAYNMLAGSILFLEQGTAYEVKLDLSDPDGGEETKVFTILTRPIPALPQGGRTLHVAPGGAGGDGSAERPFSGVRAAQAQAQPGDVMLLHAGNYGAVSFDRSGQLGRYLVWKAAGDGEALFEHVSVTASHVWLEGLTLRRASQSNGLRGLGTARDVVVSRCLFAGFHYSIALSRTCADWYIADNTIIGDNDPVTGGISGEGIELNHSSGHVVAHNSISRTADGVSYPHRNCDIYGNEIFDVSDDGLEPDYGYANNRMWANRLTNCKHAALSFQPMYCGPWYFIRNQAIGNCHIFKFRVQDRFVLAHNTFVRWGTMDNRMHHILTSLSRNNLYISAGGKAPIWAAHRTADPRYTLPDRFELSWMTDVDYDGFDWADAANAFLWDGRRFPDVESFARAIGIERHGRRVRAREIFERFEVPVEPGRVGFLHLTLKPNANAIDAGQVLPNINEDYEGAAPDLGAYEYGKALPHYGPRPSGR